MGEQFSLGMHFFNQAAQMHQQGNLDGAYSSYIAAVRHEHGLPEAWNNLGCILLLWKKWDAAIACYLKAIDLQPTRVIFRMSLANALWLSHRMVEAKALLLQTLETDPSLAAGWFELATILIAEGKTTQACEALDRALQLDPSLEEAELNKAFLLLSKGDYKAGFPAYEVRFSMRPGPMRVDMPNLDRPIWRGEDLAGKSLLIVGEQGLGDTIQFSRYLGSLPRNIGSVVVVCYENLYRLLSISFPDLPMTFTTTVNGTLMRNIDFYCPLLSLPIAMSKIPSAPYLRAPEQGPKVPKANGTKRTIGIVWAGSPGHTFDKCRSARLEDFFSALALPGVELFSLQVGASKQDPFLLGPMGLVRDLSSEIADFADTAYLIEQLDTIVTVDTSVAHLAGALGKRCHVLIPFLPDWRWGTKGSSTHWYPSLTLHRQKFGEDWKSVLKRVAHVEFAPPSWLERKFSIQLTKREAWRKLNGHISRFLLPLSSVEINRGKL